METQATTSPESGNRPMYYWSQSPTSYLMLVPSTNYLGETFWELTNRIDGKVTIKSFKNQLEAFFMFECIKQEHAIAKG